MVAHGLPGLGSAVTILFFGWLFWTQFKRLRKEWPYVRAISQTWATTLSASIKPFYQVTPAVAFVEALCLVLAGAVLLLWFALGIKETAPYVQRFFTGIFFLAGTLECIYRGTRLARHAWTRTAGKFLLAGMGAAVVLLATAAARHVVIRITQSDPKFFPSFTGLLALGLTPLFYLYGICLLAALWSLLECICLTLLLPLFEVTRTLGAYVRDIRRAVHSLTQSVTLEQSARSTGDMDGMIKNLITNFGRSFLFLGFTVVVLAAGISVLQAPNELVNRSLRVALVALEYNEQPICGTTQTALLVPLESGHYSLARTSKFDAFFSSLTCPKS
jgi:hypothetical protein